MADEFDPPSSDDSAGPDPTDSSFFDNGRNSARDVDSALQLQGQSRQQRALINKTVYDATDNKNLSRDERRQAQRDFAAQQKHFGFRFDWAEWRREKERRGDSS
jgi:hypothetical protein